MGIKCRNEQGCAVCEKVAPNQCPGCEVKYCSRECQKKDWKQHKKTCFNLLKKTMSMPEPDAEPIEQPPEELTKMTVGDLKRKSRSLGATEYQVTSSAPNPHLVLTQPSPDRGRSSKSRRRQRPCRVGGSRREEWHSCPALPRHQTALLPLLVMVVVGRRSMSGWPRAPLRSAASR